MNPTETPQNEESFCLVGTTEITSILQKTPSRVLLLVPNPRGGWQVEKEFESERWNIRKEGGNFFVYNQHNSCGRNAGHTSEPFPAFDTDKLTQ